MVLVKATREFITAEKFVNFMDAPWKVCGNTSIYILLGNNNVGVFLKYYIFSINGDHR